MNRAWILRTLRRRLTLALGTVAVAVVTVDVVVGVFTAQSYLDESTRAGLTRTAASVRDAIDATDGRPQDAEVLGGDLGVEQDCVTFVAEGRVLHQSGSCSAQSRRASTLALARRLALPQAVDGSVWAVALDVQDAPLLISEGDSATRVDEVILTTDASQNADTIRAIVGANTRADLVGLAVLIAITVVLVGRQLRPLARMSSRAAALAGGDRGARLPAKNSDDSLDRLAEAVNAAFDSQVEAETRVRAFVADASHELRTPLTVANGWVTLDLEGGLRDEQRRRAAMERVGAQLTRMRSLIDDLALLARTDEGRGLSQERVDLAALLRDVVEDARIVWPDTGIALEVAGGNAFTVGDGQRLLQVFRNLIGNAIEHTRPGTCVTVGLTEHRAGWHRAVVRDDGDGISADDVQHLFERFWRGDSSRTRLPAGGGTGLGLAIVKSIVTAHRGEISVDSVVGVGTAFAVDLRSA